MSWDIFVEEIPPSIRSVDEMPSNFQPAFIGRRSDVISRILEVVPFADLSDPTLGRIDGSTFSIEVNMGNDPVRHLLHLGLRAFDPQAPNGIFELEVDPTIGLRKWRAYRDSVLHK